MEFVATSVTLPGLDPLAPIQSLIPVLNPHIKYVDLSRRGYMVLDLTPERITGEHWYVNGIEEGDSAQAFGVAYAVADGSDHLVQGAQTEPGADAPPPAP